MKHLKNLFKFVFRENTVKNYFQFVPYLLFTIPSFFLLKALVYQFSHYVSHSSIETLICFVASVYVLMIIILPVWALLVKTSNGITYYHSPKKINHFIIKYNKKIIKKYLNLNEHPEILKFTNYISLLFILHLRRDIQLLKLDNSFDYNFNDIADEHKEQLKSILTNTYGLDVCFAFSILTNNENFYKFLISLTKKPIINMELFSFDEQDNDFTLDSFLFKKANFAKLYIPNDHLIIGSPYIYNHLNSEKAPDSILSLLKKTTWKREAATYSSNTHVRDMTQFNEFIYHKTLETQAIMKREYEDKKTFFYYIKQKEHLYDMFEKFRGYIDTITSLEEQLEYAHYLEKMIFILNEINEENYSTINKDCIFIDLILTNIPSIISDKIDDKDKLYFLSHIDSIFEFLFNQINQEFKCVSSAIDKNYGHYKLTCFN
jgi:hypothetical protein